MYPIILPAIHPYQTASVLPRSPTPEKECIPGFHQLRAFVFLITRWPECCHLSTLLPRFLAYAGFLVILC
jgi:hypothetical protein